MPKPTIKPGNLEYHSFRLTVTDKLGRVELQEDYLMRGEAEEAGRAQCGLWTMQGGHALGDWDTGYTLRWRKRGKIEKRVTVRAVPMPYPVIVGSVNSHGTGIEIAAACPACKVIMVLSTQPLRCDYCGVYVAPSIVKADRRPHAEGWPFRESITGASLVTLETRGQP